MNRPVPTDPVAAINDLTKAVDALRETLDRVGSTGDTPGLIQTIEQLRKQMAQMAKK